MLDWTAHLKHLQSILLKSDPTRAQTKLIMLKYFQKDLKLSILAELEYQNLELKSFDQIVKKIVNVKAKTALRLHSGTHKID